ncbi:MAG: Eco57I restriction-modification methylase domain-containing protein [Ignavibacteriae bacterium]|nr:Eco57I restriction-modification methylase domain-containing protein [Ignavibacteriota bacterium]
MHSSLDLVRRLVGDFDAQKEHYLSPGYQESQARQDFIDKFFIALGWDVTHERQKNPYEQEVKIENRVKVSGSQRYADYAFFVAPNFRDVKFYVEAKKPSRTLANLDDYYQALRYGWNSNTPLAVLTDFEEFHILDCRYKPDRDTALDRKIESFHFIDYTNEETFARIFYLFGREAVANGSLEKRAAELPKPRGRAAQKALFKGYQQVDEAFLVALDGYRDTLAHIFKANNPKLNGEELTEAVQRTLDRLVFIRFLEDKQIEDPMIVDFHSKASAWNAFVAYCKSLEPKYNGLIFKPHRILDPSTSSGQRPSTSPSAGSGQSFNPPDDEKFADICSELSDRTSPYDFDKIPISILGSIYERFLGKVVVATEKRVRVEEKAEVRKAGGVYYTPEYIVRYIVKETVGTMIEGKTPDQVAKMAFADIACGSGSFLLEVYDTLLEYHRRWYNEHPDYVKTSSGKPDKAKKADVEERDGRLALTLKKRQEILSNNIYGVDIDFQATEVTQLSLYLKLLEDVTLTQLHLFKEKVLPNLTRNIVCGNSLIEPDIFESQQSLFIGAHGSASAHHDADNQLKPMRFTDAFPDVMSRGGFDAVVGNPPYIRIQAMREFNPLQVELLKKKYRAASKGNYDIYVVFVERAMTLLNAKGQLGYILPHKFFNAQYGEPLRKLIADGNHLSHVVHFGDQQVFEGATTYTCLLFLSQIARQKVRFVKVTDLLGWRENGQSVEGMIPSNSFSEKEWNISVGESSALLEKLKNFPIKLGDVAHIFVGTQTSADEVFVLDDCSINRNVVSGFSKSLDKLVRVELEITRPFLRGKEIRRYEPLVSTSRVITPYDISDDGSRLVSESELKKSFPLAYSYLKENKEGLIKREKGKFRGDGWFAFGYPKSMTLFSKEKLIVPDYNNVASFTIDRNGHFYKTGYGVLTKEGTLDYKYVLALLNSTLLFTLLKSISTSLRGGYIRFWTQFIEQLPIRTINLSDESDKARHDHIVKLVEQMLAAKEKLAKAKTDSDVNRLELECESLDRQIDAVVYELYGLTEEEIKIVEGK